MSNLTVGTIGYVLGKCPVLIISEPNITKKQQVIYLRKTGGNQTGVGKRKDPKNVGEIVERRSIHPHPQKDRYQITSTELLLADKLADEYINFGKIESDRCVPSKLIVA